MCAGGGDVLARGEYVIGAHVEAISKSDGQWYRGKIHSSNNDSTFTVRWDDPGAGPKTTDVNVSLLNRVQVFNAYAVGDHCQARSPVDNKWYPGTVSSINQNGSFAVGWDSPYEGPDTSNIEPHNMIKVQVLSNVKLGDTVLAASPDDGRWCPGIVEDIAGNSTFVVRWDDPGDGPKESRLGPKKIRLPRVPIEELVGGRKYQGTVLSLQPFGAYVDIGANVAGLLKVASLTGGRIGSIHNHLREGQAIDVWILALGRQGFELVLSQEQVQARRPSWNYEAFEGIPRTQWLEGSVDGLTSFGAFVTVRSPRGAYAKGVLHARKMGVSVLKGEKIKVRVLSVDTAQKKMDLTNMEDLKRRTMGRS